MKKKSLLKGILYGTGFSALAVFGLASSEYQDVFGFDNKAESGRTKNSIAAVVTGIIGQELYGNSRINVDIEKTMWPDAKVTGYTTSDSIETHVDLLVTSAHFSAKRNGNGHLEGTVDKSEFDWNVKQIGPSSYDVNRFGPKFDARVDLTVEDGKITGTYVRPGPHFDWEITGTYNDNGDVNYTIDGPLNLGITLNGKITKAK